MSDKLGPTPPGSPPASTAQPGATVSRPDPRQAVKSKLTSVTSVTVDATLSLDGASAQLSALRHQADAAAASGDLSALQQVAVHAVAIGVAAGQNAESLAGAIAAKLAGVNRNNTVAAKGDGTTALGLRPEEIARLFTDKTSAPVTDQQGTSGSSATGGTLSALHELAALNARASAVITDARGLLASMNQAIGSSSNAASGTAGDQGVALNGLSQLLDQAENALTAHIYGTAQQIGGVQSGGTSTPAGDVATPPNGLNVKT